MTETIKRLGGPLIVPAVATTIYTVPVATSTVLRHLRVVNSWGAAIPLFLSIGVDDPSTRILNGQPVQANDCFDWAGWTVLNAGEIIQAYCQPALISAPLPYFSSTSTTGGTLAAGTYYYVVTALNANGESTASAEIAITTTGTTSSNTVYFTPPVGSTAARVYRGTSAGGENTYWQVAVTATVSTSFVDTGAAGTAGTPPANNGAIVTPLTLSMSGVEIS